MDGELTVVELSLARTIPRLTGALRTQPDGLLSPLSRLVFARGVLSRFELAEYFKQKFERFSISGFLRYWSSRTSFCHSF